TLRDAIIPMVSRLAPFQHAFVQRLSELGVAYKGSPIVDGPGERFWDDSLRGGSGIRDRFLLIPAEGADTATVQAARDLCAPLRDVVELRGLKSEKTLLVRPDGYVAYSAHGGSPGSIKEIGELLERQTGQIKNAA